jgi:DNA-binding response OmpR family regulator
MSASAKPRILLVDDEESYRKSLALYLNRTRQYEIVEASSGRQAIGALKQLHYDLAILDHEMGEMSGLNVMQWIFEQKMKLPVIVLTGAGSETIAVEMMKLGAYDYVRKDQMELNQFPVLINATLDKHRFQMDRERAKDSAASRNASSTAPDPLRDTTSLFSQSAETVLGLIAEELEEYHDRVRPRMNAATQNDVDQIMTNLEEQLRLISLFTKTLADLTLLAGNQDTARGLAENREEGEHKDPAKYTRKPAEK